MNKSTILKISRGNENFLTEYEEYKDLDNNCIIINSKMKIDLNSKASIQRLNKAYKKDKSPLLLELQSFFKEHEKNKAEKTENNFYDIM